MTESIASAAASPAPAGRSRALPDGLLLVVGVLACQRLWYHAAYLETAFALGTFSDGRLYELAAVDIARHFPLGTEPFYLQGLYAYFLALPMLVRAGPSLLLQLPLAALALWLFHRCARRSFGLVAGGVATCVLLSYPALAFYENKFTSAMLGVTCNVFQLAAAAAFVQGPSPRRASIFGLASGLAILGRPNLALAVPFCVWAVARAVGPRPDRHRRLGGYALGLVLALGPLSLRNLAVTGSATVFPAHGGGTSFYIGNNPDASGLWSPVAGLVSGDVVHERAELDERLGLGHLPAHESAPAIGREMFAAGLRWIVAEPAAAARLWLRKLYLVLGNDEISQDYDFAGERELMGWAPIGLPFAALLAVALIGACGLLRRARDDAALSGLGWVVLGQIVAILAANLVFFTSAQHRVPLSVPLSLLAAPAWQAAMEWRRRFDRRAIACTIAAVVLGAQALVPRKREHGPSAVHYYNLALVQDWIGSPRAALDSLDRALAHREHPLFRLERATLHRRLSDLAAAEADLDAADLDAARLPTWARRRLAAERELLELERATAAR